MIRIWGTIYQRNKIVRDYVAEKNAEHTIEDYMDCIHRICRELDLPRPLVLQKHELDLMRFHRTRFLPDDFVETVDFDRFDVEVLIEKKKDR